MFKDLTLRKKCTLAIIIMMILDIGPIPVMASIGLWVVWLRPQWFQELVEKLYQDKDE